jgi:hypothetical protein
MGIVFAVYLVALSVVGNSDRISVFFYYGFWFVLGCLLGFRLCSYLYERGLDDQSKKRKESFNKEFENPGRLN